MQKEEKKSKSFGKTAMILTPLLQFGARVNYLILNYGKI